MSMTRGPFVMSKGKRRYLSPMLRHIEVGDECWVWRGTMHRGGYGIYGTPPGTYAHRLVYEVLVGPIAEGMTIDHLCRNRACVNPAHLEPVTMYENLMRSPVAIAAVRKAQTHCVNGHEFTPENTITQKGKNRRCLECKRIEGRNRYWKMKARDDG